MGTGAPNDDPPEEDYGATQETVVLAELRGEVAAARRELADLRRDMAPIIAACTSLLNIPKIARQIKASST